MTQNERRNAFKATLTEEQKTWSGTNEEMRTQQRNQIQDAASQEQQQQRENNENTRTQTGRQNGGN